MPGDVDRMLVAAPAERHVGNDPGQMVVAIVHAGQLDASRPDQQERIGAGEVVAC